MPDLYLPSEERRAILRDVGAHHGLDVFIETGTNRGDTPLFLRNAFAYLYTIELNNDLWKFASHRLQRYGHITCLRGDSTAILPEVLGMIDQPALVWLDGHYCGPGTGHGTKLSTPIREELKILFADGRPHVILVDDARIFDGEPEHDLYEHYADYPSLRWVERLADKHNYDYENKDDIVRLTPRAPQ